MAIKPRQFIDTVVGVARSAVETAGRRLPNRKDDGPKTSGPPSSVGAAEPGTPGGPKSGTAPKRKAKPKPRKPAKKRATASRAAASSGKEVADAAKKT